MMGVDLSIYNALLQPGPSAREISNALADRRMREQDQAMQRQLNALQLQKTQFDMEGARQNRDEENALRAYLGGNPDLTTNEGQMGLYKVAPKAAGGILKERATAAAQDATRLNQQREAQIKTLQFLGQVAGGVRDQASYDAALATIKQAGIDPASIGAPAQYNPQVVANFGQQALTQAQRLEQEWKAKEFGLKAGNELIGPDGQVNQKVLAAKQSVARSGASNISVNTEKSYAGHIAEGLAKNDVAALDAARTAPDRVNTARSIKQVLDSNKAITGTGAEARLAITKALSTAGLIDGGSTTATEDLVSMLNSQTLDAIKSSGLGTGQGFTDKDLRFLQDAKSGRIEINAQTLRRMADLNERAGLASIAYGNKIAARLKGNPTMGTVGQDLEVKPPEDGMAAAIAAEAARRAKLNGGR